MPRLLIASPHRYADLARLWHRFIIRELAPAFARLDLDVEINIFRDANASQFSPHQFPGVVLSQSGPGIRDFMEFYDATLGRDCDFLFFIDADIFFLDGGWASSYFHAFSDPTVAAVSFVPRDGAPGIFALLCRTKSYLALPPPVFACRYEHPELWPGGINLQPGDFAARELSRSRKVIVNIGAAESSKHIATFRSTTAIRSTREHILRSAGIEVFEKYVTQNPACLAAAYDNLLLGDFYERLFSEPFASDASGTHLGGSVTFSELGRALKTLRDPKQIEQLAEDFRRSEQNILKMAAREGMEHSIRPVVISRFANGQLTLSGADR